MLQPGYHASAGALGRRSHLREDWRDRAPALRRRDHRRWSQRAGERGLPRARRPPDARPGASARPGRRRGHGGGLPGLPLQRRELRREPAAAGDHPRPGAAPARAAHPAPRRHVHAPRRRLPVAHGRPRPDDARDPSLVGSGRRGVQRVRPADGRDGALHQAHPGHHARSTRAAPTRATRCRWAACCATSPSCRGASRRPSCSS